MGSFGKVFKGTWLCTDVAVKQMRRGASVSESIQRETMIHSRLRHPNIVTFMGISLIKKKDVLLVTEFVAGSSLQDIIDEEKEVEETHGLVVDILKGVAYLHEVGVVHGDIKPANILVSSNLNVAKLCDFGLGRLRQHASMSLVSQQIGAESVFEGTPSYMAPECLLGKKRPIQCSDIWSLGITLLEFLTLDDAWNAVFKDIQASSEVEKLLLAQKSSLLSHTLAKLNSKPKLNIGLCLSYDMTGRPTALQLLKSEW